jgi:hypothetical protein
MKALILSLLLCVSTFSFGQKIETTYQVQSGTYNKYSKKWDWNDALDREIEIKLDKSVVYIYNNANTILYTYEDLGEKNDYDKDGDKYKTHTWRAYDDKNRKCLFMMTWYVDIKLIVYSVIYSDTGFRFYIRNNELSNFEL